MEREMIKCLTTCMTVVLTMFAAPATLASTVFSVAGEPGEPIGLGETKTYTDADSELSISGDSRHVIVRVDRDSDSWYVSLGAPNEQKFEARRFLDAENPTRRTGRAPYVYLSSNGRRCDDAWGEINIRQFRTDAADNLVAFEAAIVQRCNAADAPVLAAVIRHNTQPLSLRLDGDAGDYVGQGIAKTYYGDTSLFQLWGNNQALGFIASGQRDRWSAEIYPPSGQTLAVGLYPIAETSDATHAGFRFERPTRRCASISGGSLEVKSIEFDPVDGGVKALHAEFVQRCDGASEALRGTIRYQA